MRQQRSIPGPCRLSPPRAGEVSRNIASAEGLFLTHQALSTQNPEEPRYQPTGSSLSPCVEPASILQHLGSYVYSGALVLCQVLVCRRRRICRADLMTFYSRWLHVGDLCERLTGFRGSKILLAGTRALDAVLASSGTRNRQQNPMKRCGCSTVRVR